MQKDRYVVGYPNEPVYGRGMGSTVPMSLKEIKKAYSITLEEGNRIYKLVEVVKEKPSLNVGQLEERTGYQLMTIRSLRADIDSLHKLIAGQRQKLTDCYLREEK